MAAECARNAILEKVVDNKQDAGISTATFGCLISCNSSILFDSFVVLNLLILKTLSHRFCNIIMDTHGGA